MILVSVLEIYICILPHKHDVGTQFCIFSIIHMSVLPKIVNQWKIIQSPIQPLLEFISH